MVVDMAAAGVVDMVVERVDMVEERVDMVVAGVVNEGEERVVDMVNRW